MTMIALLLAVTAAPVCRAGNDRLFICTDLMSGIKEQLCNAGFSYRFHHEWSIGAYAGINPAPLFHKGNDELSAHNEEFVKPDKNRKTAEEQASLPVHQEKIEICFWPSGGWFYLSAALTYDDRFRSGFRLGAGAEMKLERHLALRLEASADLTGTIKEKWNDCIRIIIGYKF